MGTNRKTPWILYGISLLLLPVVATAVAVANPRPQGACSGIGFGCSLYGWDAALLGLLVLGLPFAVGMGLLLGLTSLLGDRFHFLRVAVACLAIAGPLYVLGATIVTGGWS